MRDPLLLGAIAVVVMIGMATSVHAVDWVNKAFPGFLILGNRVVASAGLPHWQAIREGHIFQHQIVAVNGKELKHSQEIYALVRTLPVGTPIQYRFRSGEREFERTYETHIFTRSDFWLLFGAYFLNALVGIGTALCIRYLRGPHPLASATFPAMFVTALYGLTATDLYGPYWFFRLHALCEAFLFATALHLALGFPYPASILRRFPRLLHCVYAVALGFAAVYQLGLNHPSLYPVLHLSATLAWGTAMAVMFISQSLHYFRPVSFEARQRVKVLALGIAAALSVPLVLTFASVLTRGQAPQNLISYTIILGPLSVGYAVLRHNLLEVDDLLRRSLSYTILTVALAALYVGSIATLETVFHGSSFRDSNSFALVFSAVCVLLLSPLRDRVQNGIDRLFFRSSYDFRRIVETTSRQLTYEANLDVIATDLSYAVTEALHPVGVSLYVHRDENAPLERVGRFQSETVVEYAPESTLQIDDEIKELQTGELVIPLKADGELVGILVLGPRQSGQLYGADDRRLLQTLANQGAVAVKNALAVDRLQEINRNLERIVEERTQELMETLEEIKEKNRILDRASTTDFTTNLRSRRYVMERLASEFQRCRRHAAALAVIMADLDYFKRINDTYGHLAGDAVLNKVGSIINHMLRGSDVGGRYGGEEMILILPDTAADGALAFAERLRLEVQRANFVDAKGNQIPVTVSIGVAVYRPEYDSPEALVTMADEALYVAKRGGRDRVELAADIEGKPPAESAF